MSESFDSSPATTESARSTPSTPVDRMHVFVTVGSTRFDALVQRVLSEPVLDVLRAKGYRTLDVQCGDSEFDASLLSRNADEHWEGAGELESWSPALSVQMSILYSQMFDKHLGKEDYSRSAETWLTLGRTPLGIQVML